MVPKPTKVSHFSVYLFDGFWVCTVARIVLKLLELENLSALMLCDIFLGGEDVVHPHDPGHALDLHGTVAGIETVMLMIGGTTDAEIATGSQKENRLDHHHIQKLHQFTPDRIHDHQHHTVTRKKNLHQAAAHQEVHNSRSK